MMSSSRGGGCGGHNSHGASNSSGNINNIIITTSRSDSRSRRGCDSSVGMRSRASISSGVSSALCTMRIFCPTTNSVIRLRHSSRRWRVGSLIKCRNSNSSVVYGVVAAVGVTVVVDVVVVAMVVVVVIVSVLVVVAALMRLGQLSAALRGAESEEADRPHLAARQCCSRAHVMLPCVLGRMVCCFDGGGHDGVWGRL